MYRFIVKCACGDTFELSETPRECACGTIFSVSNMRIVVTRASLLKYGSVRVVVKPETAQRAMRRANCSNETY